MACPTDSHRYFVAETVAVEDEGKVVIIAICTQCGESKIYKVYVTDPNKK